MDSATVLSSEEARALMVIGGGLELMGRQEAARALGVAPSNLPMLTGLPAPVISYLRRRPLWLASDIREFARQRASR